MHYKLTTATIFSLLFFAGAAVSHGQQFGQDSKVPSHSISIDRLVSDAELAIEDSLSPPIPAPSPDISGLDAMQSAELELIPFRQGSTEKTMLSAPPLQSDNVVAEEERSIEELNLAASINRQRVLSEKNRAYQTWLDRSNKILQEPALNQTPIPTSEPDQKVEPESGQLANASPETHALASHLQHSALEPTTGQQSGDATQGAETRFESFQISQPQASHPSIPPRQFESAAVMVQAVCPHCGRTHWIPMHVR